MASSLPHQSAFLLLFACFFLSIATQIGAQRPRAVVLPVRKDDATLQYVTRVEQRTPLVPVELVVDLGGRYMWVECDDSYVSSSYSPARCRSTRCSLARATKCGNCDFPPRPGCNNDTCVVSPENPFRDLLITAGEVASDTVALRSFDGSSRNTLVATAPRFLFSCAPTLLLDGLAAGAKGVAGFGRARVALPSQLAAVFSVPRKFGVCLSSSPALNQGFVFVGDGFDAFQFLGNAVTLTYTPLLTNPVSQAMGAAQGEPSYEYFIGVNSVRINDRVVPLNSTLLSIGRDGVGGTKITTVDPYTVLETSIHRAVTEAFTAEAAARGIAKVAPVAPFGACFDGKTMGFGREGAEVPVIYLVLQSESVYWEMLGANTMVRAGEGVWCLAFVDGGRQARTSIVIGGYQLEDNLLKFDLAASRLGFSNSLLQYRTTCHNSIF